MQNVTAPATKPVAVLVPIKAFDLAKNRLSGTLEPVDRQRLARKLAARVVRAAHPLPVFVVCEDDDVAAWAHAHRAGVIRSPGGGLTVAVEHGVARLAAEGYLFVCVAHGDLPDARDLVGVAGTEGATFVPDRHGDGTNVACVPAGAGFRFAYGPGSFARHVAEARRLRLAVRVVHDDTLSWDIDTSDDLRAGDVGPGDVVSSAGTPADAARTRATRTSKASTMHLDLPVPRRALAIAAHPDDVEFQCGATFAKWAAHGCQLHHLICTDGSKGSWDPNIDTAQLVATRAIEQRNAADALGSTGEVRFLGAVDGELEQNRAAVGAIARIIRELRPDVVLAHDPWRRWRLHPDHRNAGFLACDAVVAARDPHFFPEHGLAPHRPAAMLLFESEEPDHAEDVTGYEAAKIRALFAHVSQFETTMNVADRDDSAGREAFDARIRRELTGQGRLVGVASAETFVRLRDL